MFVQMVYKDFFPLKAKRKIKEWKWDFFLYYILATTFSSKAKNVGNKLFQAAGAWLLSHFFPGWFMRYSVIQSNDCLPHYWMEVCIWVWFEIILSIIFHSVSNKISALVAFQRTFQVLAKHDFAYKTAAFSLWWSSLSWSESGRSLWSAGNPRRWCWRFLLH